MKFFVKFFAFVVLGIIALILGYYLVTRGRDADFSDMLEAQPTQKNAPPVYVAPPSAPPRNPAAATPQGFRSSIMAVASKNQLEIDRYDAMSDGSVVVGVRWISSNAAKGGDFLDTLINDGVIRDFEEMNKGGGYDRQGRQTWNLTVKLFPR